MNTIGWGKAVSNNNLYWGTSAKTNNIGFGFIYENSYSGETILA
jgi:hypothetical protein